MYRESRHYAAAYSSPALYLGSALAWAQSAAPTGDEVISVDAIHGGLLRAIGARGPQGILVYCVAVGGNCPPYSRNCSDGEGGLVVADGGGYARFGDGDVFRLALNADVVHAGLYGCDSGGA